MSWNANISGHTEDPEEEKRAAGALQAAAKQGGATSFSFSGSHVTADLETEDLPGANAQSAGQVATGRESAADPFAAVQPSPAGPSPIKTPNEFTPTPDPKENERPAYEALHPDPLLQPDLEPQSFEDAMSRAPDAGGVGNMPAAAGGTEPASGTPSQRMDEVTDQEDKSGEIQRIQEGEGATQDAG